LWLVHRCRSSSSQPLGFPSVVAGATSLSHKFVGRCGWCMQWWYCSSSSQPLGFPSVVADTTHLVHKLVGQLWPVHRCRSSRAQLLGLLLAVAGATSLSHKFVGSCC
jgi:hypothetical protein